MLHQSTRVVRVLAGLIASQTGNELTLLSAPHWLGMIPVIYIPPNAQVIQTPLGSMALTVFSALRKAINSSWFDAASLHLQDDVDPQRKLEIRNIALPRRIASLQLHLILHAARLYEHSFVQYTVPLMRRRIASPTAKEQTRIPPLTLPAGGDVGPIGRLALAA
jgi:hypothetical protein